MRSPLIVRYGHFFSSLIMWISQTSSVKRLLYSIVSNRLFPYFVREFPCDTFPLILSSEKFILWTWGGESEVNRSPLKKFFIQLLSSFYRVLQENDFLLNFIHFYNHVTYFYCELSSFNLISLIVCCYYFLNQIAY